MTENLIRMTSSICPECMATIPAEIFVDSTKGENGWVMMKKTCEKHGEFMDKISKDPELYDWKHTVVPEGSWRLTLHENCDCLPIKQGCPYDCGLCEAHESQANLMIIDVTNRCNLNCPICFANANAQGRIVEYTYDEVVKIMEHFSRQKPFPPAIAQFSGGEPTLHPRIIDILHKAKELGFPHRMLNTNGIRMAKDIEFVRQIKEADCGATYLSWDGFGADLYKKIRGIDLTNIKQKTIDNCREVGLDGIMLVMTVVNNVNNDQVKAVIEYARDNNDIIAGVIFQPVSLSGRIGMEDLMNLRYTSSDLVEEITKATDGKITQFYPLALTGKFTALISWFEDIAQWSMTAHEDCGWATIASFDEGGWKGLEEYFDVVAVINVANEIWDMVEKREIPKPSGVIDKLHKFVDDFGLGQLVGAISNFTDKMSDFAYRQSMKAYFLARSAKYLKMDIKDAVKDNLLISFGKLLMHPGLENSKGLLMNGNLMLGCMHFQDAYDLDTDRLKKCLVHYGAINPDNEEEVLEIPFCTFNAIHREPLETKWANKRSKALEKTPEEHAKEVTAFEDSLKE